MSKIIANSKVTFDKSSRGNDKNNNIQQDRSVNSVITSIETTEGEGFIVHRPFPSSEIEYFDPFIFKYYNYFISVFYKLFGKIPKSRNNYFILQKFRIKNMIIPGYIRRIEYFLLSLSRIARAKSFLATNSFLYG